MSSSDPIDFYFDFSSPYGYFAAARIDGVVAPFDRKVDWHPILLGPALKETGSKPMVDSPMKSDYALHDWARLARFMDLPWAMPDTFPISTVRAARAFYVIDNIDHAQAKAFANAIYRTYFGEGRDISETSVVGDIVASIGADRDHVLTAIETAEVKDRLRAEVDAALKRGVFGSPFVIVDDQPFWGADRFWMIKRWLKSGGW